jgi:hypothetical protein
VELSEGKLKNEIWNNFCGLEAAGRFGSYYRTPAMVYPFVGHSVARRAIHFIHFIARSTETVTDSQQ